MIVQGHHKILLLITVAVMTISVGCDRSEEPSKTSPSSTQAMSGDVVPVAEFRGPTTALDTSLVAEATSEPRVPVSVGSSSTIEVLPRDSTVSPVTVGQKPGTADHSYGTSWCGGLQKYTVPELNHFVHWTPDGRHLVFDYRTTIASVDIEATRLRTIADTSVPTVYHDGIDVDADLGFDVGTKRRSGPIMGVYAAISPDGSRIAYTTCEFSTGLPKRHPKTGELLYRARHNTFNPEIATVGFDGSDPLRVTENTVADYFPEWSPDGTRLAYGVTVPRGVHFDSNTGRQTTFIRTPGRYDLRRVGEAPHDRRVVFAPPMWSSDGERIAFVAVDKSSAGFHKAIFTVRPDGTDPHRVFRTNSIPSWSPDGQRLAFVVRTSIGYSLSTIGFDGTDLKTVALLPDGDGLWDENQWDWHDKRGGIIRVEWSPTGEHIAVASRGGYFCIFDLNGEIVGLIPEGYREGLPTWSPDGTRIALYAYDLTSEDHEPVLYTMSPQGTDVEVILRGGRRLVPENALWADLVSGMMSCSEGVVVKDPQMNQELVRDCQTLVGLRDSLSGRELLIWGRTIPIEEWEGISVGGSPQRVTHVEIEKARFDRYGWPERSRCGDVSLHGGIIPASLGELDGLKVLSIRDSCLSGEIPADLGELLNLEVLELERTSLSGGIPSQLGELESLKVLNLRFNRLTGPIPPELGGLESLEVLRVDGNQLDGQLPRSMGDLTLLNDLSLSSNQLTGPIPRRIGDLISLHNLNLGGNKFTGPIPGWIGDLTLLQNLNLSVNQLTGSIPSELAELDNLHGLFLGGNRLSGGIPSELGTLTQLRRLQLNRNRLTGTVPAELGNLSQLEAVWLGRNDLVGCVSLNLPDIWLTASGLERC